ncbi:MAG: sigma-70 family RNA polymerase sigma factor [Acidobacteriota bacterium]
MANVDDIEITDLLLEWGQGDRAALGRLSDQVYGHLRSIAAGHLRGERSDLTLQTTDLVHEVFLRLVDQRRVTWKNRNQFFAITSKMMRRVLVDHARSRGYQKRGGDAVKETMGVLEQIPVERSPDFVALDDALETLARLDPEQAQVVEMKYFGGLSKTQIAEVTGLSTATVTRRWRLARVWLFRELSSDDEEPRGVPD